MSGMGRLHNVAAQRLGLRREPPKLMYAGCGFAPRETPTPSCGSGRVLSLLVAVKGAFREPVLPPSVAP